MPTVAVGVTAPLIGHGLPKGNPLKALFAQGIALGRYASSICALKGQKLYAGSAFALTGRVYLGARIPRAMPWAMSSLAFQAATTALPLVGLSGRFQVDSYMITLWIVSYNFLITFLKGQASL